MSKLLLTHQEISEFSKGILQSPKYKSIQLPLELVESLYLQEIEKNKKLSELHKAVRKKLHNVVADYLGNVAYEEFNRALHMAVKTSQGEVKKVCLEILSSHASTEERLPNLDIFYQTIFERIGKPESILDLACGYHPFALPWMNLDPSCKYYAYDIVAERIDLINSFFVLLGYEPLGYQQDILLHPPQIEADVAFFFKEAHRFEQRQKGCNRNFWLSLPIKHLLVSLPAESMNSRHQKTDQHRRLVYENIVGLNWDVEEFQIGNELFFWIKKE